MTPMTISFEVLPGGLVDREAIYTTIRAAIAVVERSGLPYTVGSMETTIEGEYDTVMAVIKEAQEAALAAGAARVFTLVKIDYSPHQSGLCKLTYD
jgi:uncharacterized protein YqgV (UPF0045/DUF77 family)